MAQRQLQFVIVALISMAMLILLSNSCSAAKLGERTLGLGSWGADVFELQMRMHDMGYKVVADGRFGSDTKQAVTLFQRKKGLTPDGMVGNDTALQIVARYGVHTHRVQIGETLSSLAAKYDVKSDVIMRFNDTRTGLKIGQVLLIPAAPHYQVHSGDTLKSLATRFQTSISELCMLNKISTDSALRPGMWLRLPQVEY